MKQSEIIEALYDYAVAHPEGFTKYDFMRERDLTLDQLDRAIRKIRQVFADDDITLICEPSAPHQPWTYRLIGNVEGASPWARNRLADAETRLSTLSAVARTLVNATDGRTVDGRRARAMHKSFSRLMEDLDDLSQEVETWTA